MKTTHCPVIRGYVQTLVEELQPREALYGDELDILRELMQERWPSTTRAYSTQRMRVLYLLAQALPLIVRTTQFAAAFNCAELHEAIKTYQEAQRADTRTLTRLLVAFRAAREKLGYDHAERLLLGSITQFETGVLHVSLASTLGGGGGMFALTASVMLQHLEYALRRLRRSLVWPDEPTYPRSLRKPACEVTRVLQLGSAPVTERVRYAQQLFEV